MNDFRRSGLLCNQCVYEGVDAFTGISHSDFHKAAYVQNLTLHSQSVGHFSNKGPETDPLNYSP